METISIRFREETLETLAAEAKQMGLTSRAEYIRYLLRHRAVPRHPVTRVPDDTTAGDTTEEDLNSVINRMETLAADVETLAEQVSRVESQLEDQQPAGSGPDESAIVTAVSEHLEQNGVGTPQIRAIIGDAIRLLLNQGQLSAGELREQLYTQHPDSYSSAQSLWNSAVLRQIEYVPGLSRKGNGTYIFNREQAQSELELS